MQKLERLILSLILNIIMIRIYPQTACHANLQCNRIVEDFVCSEAVHAFALKWYMHHNRSMQVPLQSNRFVTDFVCTEGEHA